MRLESKNETRNNVFLNYVSIFIVWKLALTYFVNWTLENTNCKLSKQVSKVLYNNRWKLLRIYWSFDLVHRTATDKKKEKKKKNVLINIFRGSIWIFNRQKRSIDLGLRLLFTTHKI